MRSASLVLLLLLKALIWSYNSHMRLIRRSRLYLTFHSYENLFLFAFDAIRRPGPPLPNPRAF